jgi:hypothetical protein
MRPTSGYNARQCEHMRPHPPPRLKASWITSRASTGPPQQDEASFSRVPILRRLNVTPIPDIRSIRLLRRIVLRTRIRRHLRQPTRRRHTRLIMNRAEQRREALKKVPNRRHRIRCSVALGARVPDVDLRLQALDSVCVCVCEAFVGAVCEHEVLHLRRYPG